MRTFALLAAFALTASAQLNESVTVSVVEVPVTVVDANGNPVRGLTAANFQLFDDGKAQTITSFDNIDFAVKREVTAISPLNPIRSVIDMAGTLLVKVVCSPVV